MKNKDLLMQRCLQLAELGKGKVAPNPMVGCVIVDEQGIIIGEGYHELFGQAHAEVNAIRAVKDKSMLEKATLYVSLEPCTHYGKTPPCTDLILSSKIKSVVIGCSDPNPLVAGKGIKKLQDHGVRVVNGVLEQECIELNRKFFTFHQLKRPYITLKWAQTRNGLIAGTAPGEKTISNSLSRTLVHRWRSEEQAILIGTNTALEDNPALTTREWIGNHPVRIVLDRTLKIPKDYQLYNNEAATIFFTEQEQATLNKTEFVKIDFSKNVLQQVFDHLQKKNIQSVLVEGGSKLLQAFIENNCWDEALVFIGNKQFENGLKAPEINAEPFKEEIIEDDVLITYRNQPKTDL